MGSVVAHPKRTPPNATNKPITMAGHDFPGTPAGLTRAKPIVYLGEYFNGQVYSNRDLMRNVVQPEFLNFEK